MSFNEKQRFDNNEIDLGQLFRTVWFHKFSLIFVFVLSVPLSVMYSNNQVPKYRAVTVFEKPEANKQGRSSLLSNIEGLGLMSFLSSSSQEPEDNFFTEVRSKSFLKTVLFNNSKFDNQTFKKLCSLPPYFNPLKSMLVLLGLSHNEAPSESQKIALFVKCANDMLEVKYDTHGTVTTSAYKLSITSSDPIFSANLANQIVEKYFIRHEKNRDLNFRNVKKYLSKVISDAQIELTEASELMQSFKIKHTLLMNANPFANSKRTNALGVDISVPPSPFAPELNKEIANLSQLEKSLNRIKLANLKLSNLKELDQLKIKELISSTEVQGVLSRTFVTVISKIDDLGSSTKKTDIKKLVTEELRGLEKQIRALEDKIRQKEEKTVKLMNIENKYQELAIDVTKKKIIFEGLKDQLQEKILSAGLENIGEPILLTKAVPPYSSISPNKKLIVILGALISVFVGIAYILIRQMFLKRVYSLSQLQNKSKFLSLYRIKHKQLELMSVRSDETEISQSFFSNIKEIGKLGCIVDLSKKTSDNLSAATFSKAVANLLAVDNKKIVCLDTFSNKKSFFANSRQKFGSDGNNINAQGDFDNSVFAFKEEDSMIRAGEVSKIKEKYAEYDKIICALCNDVGDLAKFNFIEQCDFYVLVGRSFYIDEYDFKRFSNPVWEKEKKCLGFFLID